MAPQELTCLKTKKKGYRPYKSSFSQNQSAVNNFRQCWKTGLGLANREIQVLIPVLSPTLWGPLGHRPLDFCRLSVPSSAKPGPWQTEWESLQQRRQKAHISIDHLLAVKQPMNHQSLQPGIYFSRCVLWNLFLFVIPYSGDHNFGELSKQVP